MNKSNIFLLVLVVGLGGFWFFDIYKGEPKREEAEKQSKRFFPDLKRDQLASITIENLRPGPKEKDKPLKRELVKKHGVWMEDVGSEQHVLATLQMGQLANSLVELSKTKEFVSPTPVAQLNPADFGLDKPHWKIELKSTDGTSNVLNLGDKTPDMGGFYAQAAGGQVAAIATTLPEILETPGDKMRENSPIIFKSSKVNKLDLTLEDGKKISVELVKPREKPKEEIDDSMEITDLTEAWKMTAPHEAAADGQKVREVLYNWKGAKFGRFLKPDEKIDFSKPALRFSANVDGEAEPYQFELGPVVPAKPNMRYLRRLAPDETMVIEMNNPKMMDITETSLEQRHVALFEPDAVYRLEAKFKDLTISGRRKDKDWNLTQPTPGNSDQSARNAAISDLLFELKNMEWKSKSSEANFVESASFNLFKNDDKPAAQISLGQESGKGRLVKVEGSSDIYVVEPDPLARLDSIARRLQVQAATPSPTPGVATPGATTATPGTAATPGAATPAVPILIENGKPTMPIGGPSTPTPAK